jgi:hypothetical protein
MADIGPCKRPGFKGEGTETLAHGKAAQPSGTRPSARLPDTGSVGCGQRCRSIEALASGPRSLTVRFDDPHPPITQPKI